MNVAVVNSTTVTDFINDATNFDNFVNECFAMVDTNGDGNLSRDEICGGFGTFMPLGSYSQSQEEVDSVLELIFTRFDEDHNDLLDLNEFKSLMTEIMNAVARGIGGSPIIVALEKDSLLMKAVQRELATQSYPS
ncbi:hypothetical protein P8452_03494 [Trifolium repens]|jgi:Ca2+-binding EF-hand superfamily protein|nr:calcium-binding EF-hand family protein [Trifolium repens]WJX13057.1 hypothetical protein P8452_03494 [Trifolium repens]